MNDSDNLTFTINQVAKMIGVVPATIRNWEKNGLITVKRSSSNCRVFTMDDIKLLKKIKEYSVDRHMGAHAIRMLLPTSSGSEIEKCMDKQMENVYSRKMISQKWKEIRKQQGYTLEEVSQHVGISVAHLSKLENGGNISLNMMNNLAHFYHENPLYFMNQSVQESHIVRKDSGEQFKLTDDPGMKMTSLVALHEHVMYPVLCEVEPGHGGLLPHTHNGEEFMYLLSGTLEIHLNDTETYILHPGDTFYHYGSEQHSWENISTKTARIIWVHSMLSQHTEKKK